MSPFKLILLTLLGAQTLVVGAEPSKSEVTKAIANPSAPVAGGIPSETLTALELQGRQLYLEGKSANGRPIVADREGGIKLRGQQAACVQCHQRSGLGGVEGDEAIPPISGHAIFGGGNPVIVQVDRLFNKSLSTPPKPYDDKTFKSALRLGQHVSGRKLSALMPRYELSDEELRAVSAYLKTLSPTWSPGAAEKEIHLATVITPDVSPERRKVFVETINALIKQHNLNAVANGRHKISAIERRMHSRRTWAFDVWELSGDSSTWMAQLQKRQQEKPVFAILSGISEIEWQPVQNFCENQKVACWFPSVDLVPEEANKGKYSLYFSAGIQLEADVISKQLLSAPKKPRKIVQLIGESALAQNAATTVRKQLAKSGVDVQDIVLNQSAPDSTATLLKSLKAENAVLLWLNDNELNASLTGLAAPLSPVYVSSTLAGEKLPAWGADWSANAWLIQRFELPKMRSANLSRFNDWVKYRQLPLVDEKMQSEVYFAVNSFSWMLSSMLNNLHTDYLIERAEATLSMREAMQVQEEVQSMMMGGGGHGPQPVKNTTDTQQATHVADIGFLMKRTGTTVYPRISLGIGQRFASKGAYIRPLVSDLNIAESGAKWIVP